MKIHSVWTRVRKKNRRRKSNPFQHIWCWCFCYWKPHSPESTHSKRKVLITCITIEKTWFSKTNSVSTTNKSTNWTELLQVSQYIFICKTPLTSREHFFLCAGMVAYWNFHSGMWKSYGQNCFAIVECRMPITDCIMQTGFVRAHFPCRFYHIKTTEFRIPSNHRRAIGFRFQAFYLKG